MIEFSVSARHANGQKEGVSGQNSHKMPLNQSAIFYLRAATLLN
jgi:hypothetical protein